MSAVLIKKFLRIFIVFFKFKVVIKLNDLLLSGIFLRYFDLIGGRNGVVGIASRYGLDDTEFEPGGGEIF